MGGRLVPPEVVIHVAVSADGRTTGFVPRMDLFYGLLPIWGEDVTLAGSETIRVALEEFSSDAMPVAAEDAPPEGERPLLVIVDSGGRITDFEPLRAFPFWRDIVVACSRATPPAHLAALETAGVGTIVTGDERVDLAALLAELEARYAARVVRVESGGVLNGVLLRAGLVTEVSLLVHPVLLGGASPASMFRAPDLEGPEGAIDLRLLEVRHLVGDAVWLRYAVGGATPPLPEATTAAGTP